MNILGLPDPLTPDPPRRVRLDGEGLPGYTPPGMPPGDGPPVGTDDRAPGARVVRAVHDTRATSTEAAPVEYRRRRLYGLIRRLLRR